MGGVLGGAVDFLTGQGDQSAVQAQQNAAAGANQQLSSMWNTVNQNAQPYLQAGSNALSQLSGNMSSYNQPFTMAQFQQSPGYQFSLGQGQQALARSAASSGSILSGGEQAALSNYTQNAAQNEYQQAFNNYQSQIQNSYNRLAGVAGMGMETNNSLSGMGMNMANQQGQNMMGAANAQAAMQMNENQQFGSLLGLGLGAGLGFGGYLGGGSGGGASVPAGSLNGSSSLTMPTLGSSFGY